MNAQPSENGIVVLTCKTAGKHAWVMINMLRERFGEVAIVRDEGETAEVFWSRRRRKLGFWRTASMKAAQFPIKLTRFGMKRVREDIYKTHNLQPYPADGANPISVPSVNSDACREVLQQLKPKVVLVIGTRIIGKKTLAAIDAPFINYHPGITPAYRGNNSAYFALAEGRPDLYGATVMLVDPGIDTGGVLYQCTVDVDPRDNIHTYMLRLAPGSREIVNQAVADALAGTLKPQPPRPDLPSKIYYSPTLGGYLWTGLTRGVW